MKFSKREKIFTGLFMVVLSLAFFVNTVPVKAAQPVYKVTVKAYQLYVDDELYDPPSVGEFKFQCSFDSDKSPAYTSSTWYMEIYTTMTCVETLYSNKYVSNFDFIYFKLYEYDPWPGASDTVIDWQSLSVLNIPTGYSYPTFYDGTGLYCKFQVYKIFDRWIDP